jgi:tRNA (guanine37-N1)-methyltransferase
MDQIKAIKVPNKEAQKVIQEIKENDNFNTNYKISKEKNHIFIPIKEITDNLKDKEIVILKNPEKQKEIGLNYREILLKNKISKEIVDLLPSSYDIVGDIVIINIEDKEITNNYYYSSEIGKALQEVHGHIKTVLNKSKEHHGTFRTQDLDYLWGQNKKETTIQENGCYLKTDVEKVFFSTRLSTERKRIASLVKPGEVVGVFFAGVGPFSIAIAKLSNPKEIISIELNPLGVRYMEENIVKNKMEKIIIPIEGDVKEICKKYPDYFDRIPMPLPKSAENFLDDAIFSIKNKGIIHIYNFVPKNQPFKEIEKILKEKEKKNNCKIETVYKKVIRSFSQTTVQIVMDLKISKNLS